MQVTYGILMYVEFGVGEWFEKWVFLYALSHQVKVLYSSRVGTGYCTSFGRGDNYFSGRNLTLRDVEVPNSSPLLSTIILNNIPSPSLALLYLSHLPFLRCQSTLEPGSFAPCQERTGTALSAFSWAVLLFQGSSPMKCVVSLTQLFPR